MNSSHGRAGKTQVGDPAEDLFTSSGLPYVHASLFVPVDKPRLRKCPNAANALKRFEGVSKDAQVHGEVKGGGRQKRKQSRRRGGPNASVYISGTHLYSETV